MTEFLGGLEPSLGPDRERVFLAGRSGRRANLTCRVDCALLLDGSCQVRHREAQLSQQIRLDPDAHRIIGGPENEDLPDARHAQQGIDDIDVRVVAEKQGVVRPVRRVQRHGDERQPGRFSDGHSELIDLGRQVRLRLRQPILDVHLVGVDVGVRIEGD